jgi:drug/metabolite transporter (DMT)-like permease
MPLTLNGLGLLAASAVLVSFGIVFVVIAFRGVAVSVVSPFRYSAVVWAMLFGFLIWGEKPNDLAVLGMVLIVISGLYAMFLEAAALRQRRSAGVPV